MSDPSPKPRSKPRRRSRKAAGGAEQTLKVIHGAAVAGLAAYKAVKPLVKKWMKK